LTLIVIPAVFGLVKGFGLPNKPRADIGPPPPTASRAVEPKRRIAEPAG
jgi:Cu(I)/Ag(I) efflux system membrane protein CusA/SilA